MMKYFIKLNVVSMIYAFLLFLIIELQMNFYRIMRITGWNADRVDVGITILSWILFLLTTGITIWLTARQLTQRKSNFYMMLLWAPYFFLFITVFARLFPITDPGETPAPVTGLIAIFMILVYPLYIGVITGGARLLSNYKMKIR